MISAVASAVGLPVLLVVLVAFVCALALLIASAAGVPANCTVAGVPAKIVRHHRADSCPSREMDQTI